MLAKYESHKDLRENKLCPFRVHSHISSYNSICNWHPDIEVILVLKGSGLVQYGPDTMAVQGGDIVIFNPNVLHRFHKSDDIVYHCIIPEEGFCNENGIFTENMLFERTFRSRRTEELCKNAVLAYAAYKEEASLLNGAKTRNAMLALLIDLVENHVEERNSTAGREMSKSEVYVKKVAAYLAERPTEVIKLDELAGVCGVSKCHLSREFKRYTGQTILTYANLIRCKHAEQCIASGMTITETTIECGFESVSYFSRTYKKLMGVSPSKVK